MKGLQSLLLRHGFLGDEVREQKRKGDEDEREFYSSGVICRMRKAAVTHLKVSDNANWR